MSILEQWVWNSCKLKFENFDSTYHLRPGTCIAPPPNYVSIPARCHRDMSHRPDTVTSQTGHIACTGHRRCVHGRVVRKRAVYNTFTRLTKLEFINNIYITKNTMMPGMDLIGLVTHNLPTVSDEPFLSRLDDG